MSSATDSSVTAVLHVGGLHYASEKAVVEGVLERRPGVIAVEANPVAQTATVSFDPDRMSVAELRRWVRDCGFTAPGSRRPVTSATRWCRPIMGRMTTRPWSGPTSRMAMATAGTPACRWRRWSATCAIASWSRWPSRSRSCCGRWSAPSCWGPSSPRRSASNETSGCSCSACPWSSTRPRSSSRARWPPCAHERWT